MKDNFSIKKLQKLMLERKVDMVILWPSANWRYLVPFAPIAVERPTFLFISSDKICAIVPDFDRPEFVDKTKLKKVFSWSDKQGPDKAIGQAWKSIGGQGAKTLAFDDTMPFLYSKALEPFIGRRPRLLASELMMELRQVKVAGEIEAIKKTASSIEQVISRAGQIFKAGMTEQEVEMKLRLALMEEGAQTLDYVLVQACPNSASPHHLSGATVLKKGEPVLLDIAVSKAGYYADITRQVCLGNPSREYLDIFKVVLSAQAEAVQRVKPGVSAGDIDAAAREVIKKAGMGQFFIHRTGHGLGLEVHEPPSVDSGNPMILKSGMVFTIEPGIYLQGQFGVRIEDTVAVTEKGAQRLTESSRELIIL